MKTASEIEGDVYTLLKNGSLRSALSGGVYREGTRPKDSKKEDAIVEFSTGFSEQIETGIVTIMIYVPDVNVRNDGTLIKNGARIQALEQYARNWINGLGTKITVGHKFELARTIMSFPEPEIKQHFISVKLKYKYFEHTT